MSPILGRLLTETLAYDGGRQVSAYVPAAAPEAIVFSGDGQLIAPWGADLGAAGLLPTMIVGAHRGADDTLRMGQCAPGRRRRGGHERAGRVAR